MTSQQQQPNNQQNQQPAAAVAAVAAGAEQAQEVVQPEWNAEECDRFSFDDSDRFEEDSLCSWSSEPESLCNNWRGWKRLTTSSNFGIVVFKKYDGKHCVISTTFLIYAIASFFFHIIHIYICIWCRESAYVYINISRARPN